MSKAILAALAVVFTVVVGAVGVLPANATAAAVCKHPVKLHLNARGHASGDVKKFAFHITSAYATPPHFDVIGDMGVNSTRHGAHITSLTGTDSRGRHWHGIRVQSDLWRFDDVSKKHHTYITSATAEGCFG